MSAPATVDGKVDAGRIELLGLPVDPLSRVEALAACEAALADPGSPPLQVVTLNPEMVMHSRRRPDLALAIRSAGLVLADGWGITWAARRLGRSLPERIPGVDFLQDLLRLAAERGESVFLLGAAPGVPELAYRRLRSEMPELILAGALSPTQVEAEGVATAVRASGARVIAVAFGVPGQDLWLHRHLLESGCRVGMGVGGSLDYLSGKVGRAPRWMRAAGLEWAYRLLRQPWRLPRMLRGGRFFWEVARAARGVAR